MQKELVDPNADNKQYLIYLTNGTEEACVSIIGEESTAIERCRTLNMIIIRDDAYFELREFKNATTSEYTVIDWIE